MLGRLLLLSLVTPAMVAGYDDRCDEAQHATRTLLSKGGARVCLLMRKARIDEPASRIRENEHHSGRCPHESALLPRAAPTLADWAAKPPPQAEGEACASILCCYCLEGAVVGVMMPAGFCCCPTLSASGARDIGHVDVC